MVNAERTRSSLSHKARPPHLLDRSLIVAAASLSNSGCWFVAIVSHVLSVRKILNPLDSLYDDLFPLGKRGSNLKLIKSKCHLREVTVGRQTDENGYTECILSAYQTRSLQFAIDTIRNFLRYEDPSAVIVIEANLDQESAENSSEAASSTLLSNFPPSQREAGTISHDTEIAFFTVA